MRCSTRPRWPIRRSTDLISIRARSGLVRGYEVHATAAYQAPLVQVLDDLLDVGRDAVAVAALVAANRVGALRDAVQEPLSAAAVGRLRRLDVDQAIRGRGVVCADGRVRLAIRVMRLPVH